MRISKTNTSQIIIISPESWNGHFVSKHHYAITLALRGYKVYFLNPPDNNLSAVTIKESEYSNLWIVSAPIITKGLRFYPALLRRYLETRWLLNLEKKIGYSFSTIWLFENSRFFDMRFAANRLKIYHQVDLNQNFHISTAAKTADICFCTTDFIQQKIIAFNQRVYKIHHAVATFENQITLTKQQEDNFTKDKLHATYIGNLAMTYLDIELLTKVVKSFPNIQFHFVGMCQQTESLYYLCKDLTNICWWGKVNSAVIPAILNKSDVLLLTYQMAHYRDQASPHKLMEYLSSGKVIVATYTDEYKDKSYLLEMVENNDNYLALFEKVINNLSYYNSLEKQKKRIDFANNNTYYKQLNNIISHLKQHNLSL